MKMRRWPFPGEQPVHRARKVALAYRHTALEYADVAEHLRTIIEAVENADRRLLAYDSPKTLAALDIAMKAAREYLDNIHKAETPQALDERFTSWGETFHCEQPEHYEDDDLVKGAQAAKLIHVSPKTMSTERIRGRIKGIWDPEMATAGGYWYRVGDVYALSSELRGRAWRRKGSTDTLNDSRTGDSE
jgi:hypothetical protein